MSEIKSSKQNQKQYDLEERTLIFSKKIIKLAKELPKNQINFRLVDQLIRSGTSLGANYREANETETKKDFNFRIRICRKEGKETFYWLKLLADVNPSFQNEINYLANEVLELVKIFAAILMKSK